MVSKKRLDFGFNGFRTLVVPRAPRSIRKRGPSRELVEDNQLCAFELLAAVASKLLMESESSASRNVAEGKPQLGSSGDDKALKSESFGHESSTESTKLSGEEDNILSSFNGTPQAESDQVVEQASVDANSGFLEKIDCIMKLGMHEEKNSDKNATCIIGSSGCVSDSFNGKAGRSEVQLEDGNNQIGHLSLADTLTAIDPAVEYMNTNVLTNPESSVKFPLYRDSIPGGLLKKRFNNVKLGIRYNDEISIR